MDVAALREATGMDDAPPVLHGTDCDTTAWHLLQGWLEDQALARGVVVQRGIRVTAVHPGDTREPACVLTTDGGEYRADLVVAADGARSESRASIAPQDAGSRYAGVLLWRALVAEQALPREMPRLPVGEPSRELYAGPYRLVTYLVPGAHGQTAVGQRRLNLVWYDPEQGDLLRGLGLLDGETVHASLNADAVPAPVRDRLAVFAGANWPSPWREALALALAAGTVYGTPIVHYKPRRLARGRAALAGDSAHAASPMVGGGFREGLDDVAALAELMAGLSSPTAIPDALDRYQQLRLGPAARHVTVSERATADYLTWAARE